MCDNCVTAANSSQADTENADIAREKRELAAAPEMEHEELRQIYVSRGLSPELAGQVAEALTAHDALGAHLRDELGITSDSRARPLQAALASAAAFAVGALAPVLAVLLWQGSGLVTLIMVSTLALLGVLGAVAAQLGGASMLKGSARVLFWGLVAMGVTALIGKLLGTGVVA